jgi:CRISPR-associated protein Csd1
MILQRLAEHYDRIASAATTDSAPFARPGWSIQKVSFCVVLNENGTLNSFQSLLESVGKKLIARELVVPGESKPSGSGVAPCFLWDSAQYMLGYKKDDFDPERTTGCFEAFRQRHLNTQSLIGDPVFDAICSFLGSWSPELARKHGKELDEITRNFGVFRIAGTAAYAHEHLATRLEQIITVDAGAEPEIAEGMCLVSGRMGPIARLHEPKLKGVSGSQSAGALLVSFNAPAYESYGKSQSYNAPVSGDIVFRYANALNRLLSDNRRRISLGDCTVVFWAERRHPLEDFVSELFGEFLPPGSDSNPEDPERVRQVRHFLSQLRDGLAETKAIEAGARTRFFILGLAPNASRLSVRYWVEADAGELERRLGQHLRDIDIVRFGDDMPLTLRGIAAATGRAEHDPKGRFKRFDTKSVPDQLVGELARSVLTGSAYPQSLLSSMLRRIRSDGEVHSARVAAIKGCLVRNARLRGNPVEISMNLNTSQLLPAYKMGRLFALLEKMQTDSAESELNTTIKDRYFSAASTTPAVVFPRLFRLSQYHQAKLSTGARIYYEKLMQEAMDGLDCFPAHLALEDQGQFVIGYYQQRRDLFTSKKTKEEGASE